MTEYYEDLIKKYRDVSVMAQLSGPAGEVSKLKLRDLNNELIIPGVNGPRPDQQYLARDTSTDIINALEVFKGGKNDQIKES